MHVRTWEQKLIGSACLALLLAACGGDTPTGPGHNGSAQNQPGVHAVLGAGVTDTIDAKPSQALVVEVRGPGGQLASGAVVRFEAQPPSDTTRRNEIAVSMCPLIQPTCGQATGLFGISSTAGLQSISDTTDAHGRATVTVQLGHVAGRAVVRLTVPEFGLEDSATYTVLPGAAARVYALAADTALTIGASANLQGHVVDRYNNNRTETLTYTVSSGNALTLDAATGAVTGRDMGTQWLFIHFLQLPVDSTMVRVLPTGRLLVWSSYERAVRLVNLDGSATRTVVTGVVSDLGAFPRFGGTRQSITVHNGSESYGGPPNSLIVVDTTGSPRRDVGADAGFGTIIATRQLADGTLLVVGSTASGAPCSGFALFRVAANNSLTCVVVLPGLAGTYGGADISHDGTRVAYVGTDASIPNSSSFELRVIDLTTGATTVLEPAASTPRWSSNDHRVAYLVPSPGVYNGLDGTPVIINADGTGRRALGNLVFSPGLAWSPDGTYLVGRSSAPPEVALRVIRISDGADVPMGFRTATGGTADYYQPDWR